jgi:dTMP kinase
LKGFFITIEGGEGAGKSTLQKALAVQLKRAGRQVVVTREPGGTPLGRRLRRELLRGGAVDPVAELLLYAADRAQHVGEMIRPALEADAVVLCDRYSDSTMAYQGYGRRLDHKRVAALNKLAEQNVRPGLTLWLDLPVEAGLARVMGRGQGKDRLEAEAIAFHRRVRTGFSALAKKHPRRIIRIRADQPPEEVFTEAWAAIQRRLKVK